MSRAKVAVIGAGNVGATTAQRLIEKNLCDVVLFDIVDGLAEGKALDLMEAAPVEAHDCNIIGTTDYVQIKGADIVIVTAGMPRKPGMSRDDLLSANAKIISSVCENIKKHAPSSIVITVTNPLDIMTDLAAKLLDFPRERVFGMAGVLDSARMRYFLSLELGVPSHRIDAMVLGGHGDLMVPVMSQVKCDGKPVDSISEEKTQAIIERTQNGGAEVVKLLKTGSAFYAPASSAALMAKAIIENNHVIVPACAFCSGEYGIQDVYCGVPVKLGQKGVEEIIELELSDLEKQMLQTSVDKVSAGIKDLAALL